jgi:hypothetical protein
LGVGTPKKGSRLTNPLEKFQILETLILVFLGNSYLFKSLLGPKITPEEMFSQNTPGFGVQIPDFTGLDQFHIPKTSDPKSIFWVQNTTHTFFKLLQE